MTKKQTFEDFVQKAILVHGSSYAYSSSDYVNAQTKIRIYCVKHGCHFTMTPAKHVHGQGCNSCGVEASRILRSSSTDEFIEQAKKVHGNIYDYSSVDYVNARDKVHIVCDKGHHFMQSPGRHLKGHGCNICACTQRGLKQRLSKDYFVDKATAVHGDKYCYKDTKYSGHDSYVDVLCKKCCNSFNTKATNHLSGNGCPSCAKYGFSSVDPGLLYILREADLTKIGITNRTVQDRIKSVKRTSGLDFVAYKEYNFDLGKTALNIETTLLRELRQTHQQPTEIFDGSTECFYNVDLEDLTEGIERLISAQSLETAQQL